MKPTPHHAGNPDRAGTARPSRPVRPDPSGRSGPLPGGAKMLRERELARTRPLTVLGLPSRASNSLRRAGVNTIGQLISRSRDDLLTEIIGIGEGTLKAIEAALIGENLTLAPLQSQASAFTQTSSRRTRTKTGRHIKNHNTWVNPDDLQVRILGGGPAPA